MTHDLVFKAVNEGPGAELEAIVLRGAACKGYTIYRAFIGDVDDIAVLRGAASYFRCKVVVVLESVQFFLDSVIRHGVDVLADRVLLVVFRHLDVLGRRHVAEVSVIVQPQVILNRRRLPRGGLCRCGFSGRCIRVRFAASRQTGACNHHNSKCCCKFLTHLFLLCRYSKSPGDMRACRGD